MVFITQDGTLMDWILIVEHLEHKLYKILINWIVEFNLMEFIQNQIHRIHLEHIMVNILEDSSKHHLQVIINSMLLLMIVPKCTSIQPIHSKQKEQALLQLPIIGIHTEIIGMNISIIHHTQIDLYHKLFHWLKMNTITLKSII